MGKKATWAQTHSRFGHSAIYVCEERGGAALLAKLPAPVGSISPARHLRRVSVGDKVFVPVGLDKARALHEVEDRPQQGRLYLRLMFGPREAASPVLAHSQSEALPPPASRTLPFRTILCTGRVKVTAFPRNRRTSTGNLPTSTGPGRSDRATRRIGCARKRHYFDMFAQNFIVAGGTKRKFDGEREVVGEGKVARHNFSEAKPQVLRSPKRNF